MTARVLLPDRVPQDFNGPMASSGEPGRPARGGLADVTIRTAGPGDAAALLRLKQRLDRETSFMLLEAAERNAAPDAVARQLGELARSGNSVVIVAETGGELAGYVELAGGLFRRNQATAQVVIGVLAAASGRGIGAGLLRQARQWAVRHGLHRLELTVMTHNHRAIELYRRMGFSVEGRRPECLLINGQFIDEFYMALVLTAGSARALRPPARQVPLVEAVFRLLAPAASTCTTRSRASTKSEGSAGREVPEGDSERRDGDRRAARRQLAASLPGRVPGFVSRRRRCR
jgi:RimJ/RimL family protein N-acetyltransferase